MSSRIRWRTRRTRHELIRLKDRLELAKKAHILLEEKYKVLMQEAQHVRRTLVPFQQELDSRVKKAFWLLSETVISIGLRNVYKAALATTPNDDVEMSWTTVRGVSVPKLNSKIQTRTPLERGYGLTTTNYSLDKTAEAVENTVISLVEVAELKNILRILEEEIDKTAIRVSALEKVLIPSLEGEIKIIEGKLEEKERAGHIMVKWIKERRK
jgi:V/A-type H+-transporting ATPase subunit D